MHRMKTARCSRKIKRKRHKLHKKSPYLYKHKNYVRYYSFFLNA